MRTISGIMFVAATCIGSGMIALPIALAKVGLVPSVLLMFAIWGVIYYTALVNVELNLQAGRGLALGALCKHFSGTKMQYFGSVLLKLLSYALLAAYIAGGTAVTEKILGIDNLVLWYIAVLFLILLMPSAIVKQINNILFLILLSVTGILIIALLLSVNWCTVPLVETSQVAKINIWSALLPVVFTSFGFQVIFHTLTDYYKCDAIKLKRVFFWGSLLPSFVYIIWTTSILVAISNHSEEFYMKMVEGNVDVGELVSQLSFIAQNTMVQSSIKWIACLAIITSAIGVGLGLVGAISQQIEVISSKCKQVKLISVVATVFPAGLIVVLIPGAFISILGFAGMILSFIAILIPLYLLKNIKGKLFYKELRNKPMLYLSIVIGIIIILCEISAMM